MESNREINRIPLESLGLCLLEEEEEQDSKGNDVESCNELNITEAPFSDHLSIVQVDVRPQRLSLDQRLFAGLNESKESLVEENTWADISRIHESSSGSVKNIIDIPLSLDYYQSRPSQIVKVPLSLDQVLRNDTDLDSATGKSHKPDLKLIFQSNSGPSLGYESDVSNITNWDTYYETSHATHVSTTPSCKNTSAGDFSDWDEDISDQDKLNPFGCVKRITSSPISLEPPIEHRRKSTLILAVGLSKNGTKKTRISLETTLFQITAWLGGVSESRVENFSYGHWRFPLSKFGKSIGEIIGKKNPSLKNWGLIFFIGPVQGRLSYKMMVKSERDLQAFCGVDGFRKLEREISQEDNIVSSPKAKKSARADGSVISKTIINLFAIDDATHGESTQIVD